MICPRGGNSLFTMLCEFSLTICVFSLDDTDFQLLTAPTTNLSATSPKKTSLFLKTRPRRIFWNWRDDILSAGMRGRRCLLAILGMSIRMTEKGQLILSLAQRGRVLQQQTVDSDSPIRQLHSRETLHAKEGVKRRHRERPALHATCHRHQCPASLTVPHEKDTADEGH